MTPAARAAYRAAYASEAARAWIESLPPETRKAAEKKAQLEAEREAARLRKEERDRKAAEDKARREAEKQARKEAKEEARRKAAEAAAPVMVERKHATTDEAIVEQLGQGRKIETRGDQHAVYVYQDEHKDFAFLVSDEDKKLQEAIERMGIAIRAYMASSTNEKRTPMRSSNVKDHIARLQNRWRG